MTGPPTPATAPELDALLNVDECAAWLRITPVILLKYSGGHRPMIPCLHENRHLIRYHPRTILAKFAKDSGVPPEIIAASFGSTHKPPAAA